MFIALYKFEIKPGTAETFRQHWLQTTAGIASEYGGLGSRLHSTESPNVFIGYAQWPDRETWAAEKPPLSPPYEAARLAMRECLVDVTTLYELTVTDDALQLADSAGAQ